MADAVDQLLRSRCVASFSENQRYLAIVGQNGTLRIWQTVTNMLAREFVPRGHLSSRILAVCWLPPGTAHASPHSSSNAVRNKKRRAINGTELTTSDITTESTHVVLGLAHGGLLLYDILTGDFQTISGSERFGKITGICSADADDSRDGVAASNATSCYAVTQNGDIIVLNTQERRVENSWKQSDDAKDVGLFSCCLLDNCRKLVVGGRGTLSVWSLPYSTSANASLSKKRRPQLLWSTTAHANPVLHVCRAKIKSSSLADRSIGSGQSQINGAELSSLEYVVAAANKEQWLSIWRFNAEGSDDPNDASRSALNGDNYSNLLTQHGSLSFAEQEVVYMKAGVFETHAASPSEADEVSSNSDGNVSASSKTPQLHLTASVCSTSGKMFVYNMRLRARNKKRSPRPPHCVVRFAANADRKSNKSNSTTIPVIVAQPYIMLSAESTANVKIAVAYGGNASALAVETVSLDELPPMTSDGDDFVMLRKDPAALTRPEFSVVDGISVHDVPLGMENISKKRFNDSIEPVVTAPGLRTSKPAVTANSRSADRQSVLPAIDDEDEVEREIDPSVMTVADQLRLIEGDEVKNKASNTVQASGLIELIKQGLRSQDRELIASVINRGDSTIIAKTISKLSVTNVVPLLTAIVNNVTSQKAVHDAAPCLWLKQLLITHGTFLATAPDARVHLNSLASILDARLRTFHSLLRVKGKLELLAAQRKAAKRVATRSRRQNQPESGNTGFGVNGKISISAALSSSHTVAAVIHESDDDDDDELGGTQRNIIEEKAHTSEDDDDEAEDDVASETTDNDDDEFFAGTARKKKRIDDDVADEDDAADLVREDDDEEDVAEDDDEENDDDL